MQGTYYETDRIAGLLFVIVITAILFALLKLEEKKRGINDSNRAEMYRRIRDER